MVSIAMAKTTDAMTIVVAATIKTLDVTPRAAVIVGMTPHVVQNMGVNATRAVTAGLSISGLINAIASCTALASTPGTSVPQTPATSDATMLGPTPAMRVIIKNQDDGATENSHSLICICSCSCS